MITEEEKKEIDHMLEILTAYKEGKTIQVRSNFDTLPLLNNPWKDINIIPYRNIYAEYQVAPNQKTFEKVNELLNTNYKSDNEIKWDFISINQKLSEDFIRKFQDKVKWLCISSYQKLSEDFIREFQDKVNWYWVSRNQKLSEDFIREFQDKVNWKCISGWQTLSENFIREFKDKLYWKYVINNNNLSNNFIKEMYYFFFGDTSIQMFKEKLRTINNYE